MEFNQNVGKFYIEQEFISNNSFELIKRIFKDIVVIRARQSEDNKWIKYYARSPLFKQIKEYEKVPTYRFRIIDKTKSYSKKTEVVFYRIDKDERL
jgi:hypothetical protein